MLKNLLFLFVMAISCTDIEVLEQAESETSEKSNSELRELVSVDEHQAIVDVKIDLLSLHLDCFPRKDDINPSYSQLVCRLTEDQFMLVDVIEQGESIRASVDGKDFELIVFRKLENDESNLGFLVFTLDYENLLVFIEHAIATPEVPIFLERIDVDIIPDK